MDLLFQLRTQLPDVVDDRQDEMLLSLIETSKNIYYLNRFPYTDYTSKVAPYFNDVEPQYEGWIVECAKELYSRMGAEGETQHSEGGITRTYTSEYVSKMLLAQIIPYCGTI